MRKKFRDSDDDEDIILSEPKNKELIERKRQRKQENKKRRNIGSLIEQITSRYNTLNSVSKVYFYLGFISRAV